MKRKYKHLFRNLIPESIQIVYRRISQKKALDEFLADEKNAGYKEIDFLRKEGWFTAIPYEWTKEYNTSDYKIKKDKLGVFFCFKDKKLYFRRDRSKGIGPIIALRDLMIEQDKRSPHWYYSENFYVKDDDIFIDCGAAEGLITLEVIDRVKHAYLFECDKEWDIALKNTFSKYNSKITIINKYINNYDDDRNDSLEKYLRMYPSTQRIVIKMDIEGMEAVVLNDIITKCDDMNNLYFTVCTYHKSGDADDFELMFNSHGYRTEFSDGYMVFGRPKEFRKGIIRAWKD